MKHLKILVPALLVTGAVVLAMAGIKGWGWLIVAAIIISFDITFS
jgi:hypothetical protein